jgi:hypothetical protein
MYDRIDMPSQFEYPEEGLLPVQGMLSAADINNPNSKNLEEEHFRRVIKDGFTTNTTKGTLFEFMSHVREYFATGNLDSVEVAILPRQRLYRVVILELSSSTPSADLLACTLVERTREPIRRILPLLRSWDGSGTSDELPDANLHFDDLKVFLVV